METPTAQNSSKKLDSFSLVTFFAAPLWLLIALQAAGFEVADASATSAASFFNSLLPPAIREPIFGAVGLSELFPLVVIAAALLLSSVKPTRSHKPEMLFAAVTVFLITAAHSLFGAAYGEIELSTSPFVFTGFYFAMRGATENKTLRALAVLFALAWAAPVTLKLLGEHITLSEILTSAAADTLICAALYRLTIGRKEPLVWRSGITSPAVLIAVVVLYWIVVLNQPFFEKATLYLGEFSASGILLLTELFAFLFFAFAAVMFLGFIPGFLKSLLVVLTLIAAGSFYFTHEFGTIINTDMMRNVFATDYREAGELVTPAFIAELILFSAPALWATLTSELTDYSLRHRFLRGTCGFLGCAAATLVLLYISYQGFSSAIRGEPILRHLITPLNAVSAAVRTAVKRDIPSDNKEKIIIDPAPSLTDSDDRRPLLLVVVVGETVRLANWGLAGYSRNTTPELARRNVIAFRDTVACGTSTDVSLPCMFSRIGRDNYDRKKIVNEESLLPLMQRAGARVTWIDNQSGCKGVCSGVETVSIRDNPPKSLCSGGACFDEALLAGVRPEMLDAANKVSVVFMHQIGNHGPAYYKRYPKNFEVFKPACRDEKLQNCTKEEIVNAYDNAVLYTDHFLSGVIDWLSGFSGTDTALLYVSDHGESLGENRMYLHGAPDLIAPDEQTHVPMMLWVSESAKQRLGLNDDCVSETANRQATHDNLFSTILGITGVKSVTYEAKKDLLLPCRRPSSLPVQSAKNGS